MSNWIQTLQGGIFELETPVYSAVYIKDIATSLSKLCRYTGHIKKEFYSVAEHCVLMSRQVPLEQAWEALMHDAPEAYYGDISQPLKNALGLGNSWVLEKIDQQVYSALGLPLETTEPIKEADLRMLITERAQLLNWPPPKNWNTPNLPPYLIKVHGWLPHIAEQQFLQRVMELKQFIPKEKLVDLLG